MTNIVKAESKDVAEMAATSDAWGANEMTAQDIVIPKLLLMQGMSEQVSSGKAKLGDYVNSVTQEILGSVEKPIEIVPFMMEKFWVHNKFNGKKWAFDFIERMTPQNQSDSWEYTNAKGEKCKRIYTYNFYVLVAGQALPLITSFSSTSAKAGKELATQMYTINALAKKAPASKVILLGGKIDKNDDGSYAVKSIKVARNTTDEELTEAFSWYTTIKGGGANVDTSDGVPF